MNKVHIRELTAGEISSLYLPLRLQVLHSECGWSRLKKPVPESFRDAFDGTSIQFGCFDGDQFAGALRLIVLPGIGGLPSGPYLPGGGDYAGRSAELSRGMMDPAYRERKFFPLLVKTCLDRAEREGVHHLIVSTPSCKKFRRFYQRFGLKQVGDTFSYSDEAIEPPGPSMVLHSRLR